MNKTYKSLRRDLEAIILQADHTNQEFELFNHLLSMAVMELKKLERQQELMAEYGVIV